MKTVKEVVDEYKARQTNCVYKFVKFEKYLSQPDGYCLVKNVYRDGVKLDTLNLDTEYHKYEFESGWSECYFDKSSPITWSNRKFRGKIIEIEV